MENFLQNKSDIIAWLDEYGVQNYTLVPDAHYRFVVDVGGSVDLYKRKLKNIPVKFNVVIGNFNCSYNQLISLDGCPISVGKTFDCNNNNLTNLEHCPKSVGGNFFCIENQIMNLEYFPESVGWFFYCRENPLLGAYQERMDFPKLKEKIKSDREKSLLCQSLHLPVKTVLHKL